MHYGIFSYGTRGDVQPYIALAFGLMNKGHQVTFAAPENYKDFIEGYNINFHPLFGNVEEAMHTHEKQANKKVGNQLKSTNVLTKSNHRIVFCEGWSKIPNLPTHPNLFVISHTNHKWLMPKCKAAVIHGGAGTLAVVLKAETPVIIASVLFDQPTWGKIVVKKNIGIHIPVRKLNAINLLQAVEESQNPVIKKCF